MRLSEDLLIESRTARNEGVSEIASQSREQEILNKVKALMCAVWDGSPRVSRQQLADFYEVTLDAIDKNYQRFKEEFELDGVRVFRGDDLRDVKDILSLTSKSPQETIYTPAGALRMGFLLRDSLVARQVRTMAIRVIQGVGELVSSRVALARFVEGHIGLDQFADGEKPRIAAPYAECYEVARRELKKMFPGGQPIPGFDAAALKDFFALLSTYTDDWRFQTDKELGSSHSADRYGYPHLTSNVFPVEIDGATKRAVVMFQFCNDPLIDDRFVNECDSRRYISKAQNTLDVDLAWLFLVAPFGATPDAVRFIQNEPLHGNGFIGVLLVKDFAQFLHAQACKTRSSNLVIGEINKKFKRIAYDIPAFDLVTQYQLPLFEVY